MFKLVVLFTILAVALALPLDENKSRERRWSIGTAVDNAAVINRGYGYGVTYPTAGLYSAGYWGGYNGYPYQAGYYRGYPGYAGYPGYGAYTGWNGYY